MSKKAGSFRLTGMAGIGVGTQRPMGGDTLRSTLLHETFGSMKSRKALNSPIGITRCPKCCLLTNLSRHVGEIAGPISNHHRRSIAIVLTLSTIEVLFRCTVK